MKKILFADDSSIMRLFARMTTRSIQGISVTEAHDGLDAVEKIGKETFDLIITDINMPNMDGLQLIRHVRMMGLRIPIIILTTLGEEQDVARGMDLGADDYVTKPISVHKLTNIISTFMNVPA
jgi:CheY-like chemotaxis protein